MLCWSCRKEIPDRAVRCQHCEAVVEDEPSEEELDAVAEALDCVAPELMSEIRAAIEESTSGEDFINRIMVGHCPSCDSSNATHCEHDVGIEDASVGRCLECGHYWCLLCDEPLTKDDPICHPCEEALESDEFLDDDDDGWKDDDDVPELTRKQLIAAEVFGYSFANYRDHLGIEHIRFDNMMPDDIDTIERARREKWPVSETAKALRVDAPEVEEIMRSYEQALEVVDAENAAASFRNAVRQVVQRAVDDGLDDKMSIEKLVVQLCYRVSDLSVLLKMEGRTLSSYSKQLRDETAIPEDEDDL